MNKRKNIRLKNYDYSSAGLYFITICTNKFLQLFGKIKNGEMILNDAGKMIETEWNLLANKFYSVKLHSYIVMPNHFHGIIELYDMENTITRAGTRPAPTNVEKNNNNVGATLVVARKHNLGNIIGSFKSLTTNEYIRNVKNNNWQPFYKKLWQRNYYEHIIRNEQSYLEISDYIENNPKKWETDKYFLYLF